MLLQLAASDLDYLEAIAQRPGVADEASMAMSRILSEYSIAGIPYFAKLPQIPTVSDCSDEYLG